MSERPRTWWTDNPADPDIVSPDDPSVSGLVSRIAPGSDVTDLGGCMSLNLHLHPAGSPGVAGVAGPAGVVLRVHQPFVSRHRVIALRELRSRLADLGLLVGSPLPFDGRALLRCRGRWAELETFVPHSKPAATWESYEWMYGAMGRLHRALSGLEVTVPRPVVATYGPPGTLRRWLRMTERLLRPGTAAASVGAMARQLLGLLEAQWIPARSLPRQVVHGDVRLGNVGVAPDGATVYLDFGFAADRPRIHDLAYSLVWMVLRPDSLGRAEDFAWDRVPSLLEAYETAAGTTLTDAELAALGPYTASVPLYQAAIAGYTADPEGKLSARSMLPFLRISEWILSHPADVLPHSRPSRT